MRRLLSSLVLLCAIALPGMSAAQSTPYRIVYDDFRNGYTVDSADAKWFTLAVPGFAGTDGIPTTSRAGLKVVSPGTNPRTGLPAFTSTVAQEHVSGLGGDLDHVKWLVYMNHLASTGIPGFDAVKGQVLSCEVEMGGQTFGTEQHPFGALVDNPQTDLRLGSFAMNTEDFETFMVYDFFITNEEIYAFYERLPFARGALGNYASFSEMIPVAKTRPGQLHNYKISYDRAAGTVDYFLDHRKVFTIDRIGSRIDPPRYMAVDRGGDDVVTEMRQLNCGMGTFTLLDGALPNDLGLVRLSDQPNYYFDPKYGPPNPAAFWDDASEPGHRLWGQGAELNVKRWIVSSLPAGHEHDHDGGGDRD